MKKKKKKKNGGLSGRFPLYSVFSIFINNDCNKRRGQTSRLDAGPQVPNSCSFENMFNFDWILSIVVVSTKFWNLLFNISGWCKCIGIPLCLVTTIFAYIKIFFTLRHIHINVQNHAAQGQPSQAIPLNVARYRKAVYSALWVQETLVVCNLPYGPYGIVSILVLQRGISLSVYLALVLTLSLIYLNSSLNPLLYCWKIREVRQAVKETLRQLFR